MPSCSHVDPARVFTSLADIVHQGSTPKEMYAAICVAATLMVPGCDHASLTICRGGACSTAAVSDAVAHKIGKLEQALGTGPCLDAIGHPVQKSASLFAAFIPPCGKGRRQRCPCCAPCDWRLPGIA